jgi:hypothetical protein
VIGAIRTDRPKIDIELTFLPLEVGGRRMLPDPSSGRYVPHLVVVDGGRDVSDYLGVRFVDGPTEPVSGSAARFRCELMYYPDVDYTALRPGTSVAVREGAKTVALGTVFASPFERKELE